MQRTPFQLLLADIDAPLVAAWRREFAGDPNVTVEEGDLIGLATNTIVSPANSMGLMDGGFDELLVRRFGTQLEAKVMKAIAQRPEGELPVGAAVFVETGDPIIPNLIAAPTMRIPEAVPPSHAFFAMSAILKTATAHSTRVTRVCCPGLATGIGRVSADHAAREMAAAWRKWIQTLR